MGRKAMLTRTIAVAAVLAAGLVPALGADPIEMPMYDEVTPRIEDPKISGSFGLWGQWVKPTGYTMYDDFFEEDLEVCDDEDGFGDDLCVPAFGLGGEGKIYFDLGLGIQLETLFDAHGSLDGDEEEDEMAIYKAVGIHAIARQQNTAFGAFGGVSHTQSMADDDAPMHGFGGVEGAFMNNEFTLFGQLGGVGLINADPENDDTLGDMYFGTIGGRYYFHENAVLEASVTAGHSGRYDYDDTDDDTTATWVQFATAYEQMFEGTNVSWMVGYQGDYISTDESSSCCSEAGFAHAFKAGLSFNLDDSLQGADHNGSRTFSLPNLRAPIAYASDLN